MFKTVGQYLSALIQSFSLGFDQDWKLILSTITSSPSNTGTGCLAPETWVKVASYLQLEEQAIFLSRYCIETEVFDAILTERDFLTDRNKWECIDFGKLPLPRKRNGAKEIDIASEITDDHMSTLFDVIDARNTVKILRLTRCRDSFWQMPQRSARIQCH